MVDVGLFISYILIGVCVLAAVGMPLVKAFGDPESLKKMGIGVGALVAIFIISFLVSDGSNSGDASETTAKMVGAAWDGGGR